MSISHLRRVRSYEDDPYSLPAAYRLYRQPLWAMDLTNAQMQMAFFPSLQPFIDRGLLLATLQQESLLESIEVLGPHRWAAQLSAGILTLTSTAPVSLHHRAPSIVCRMQLLASLSPAAQSLLWGWAHPQGKPDGVLRQLRETGERDRIPDLLGKELRFPLGFDDHDDAAVAALTHEIGTAAAGILGLGPYYSASTGAGGSRILFLIEATEPPLQPVTLRTAVAKLPRLAADLDLHDPRTAVTFLAESQGWAIEPTSTGLRIADAATTAEIHFDALGRISNVQSTM